MGCVDLSGIYLHKMDAPFKVNNWKIIHLFEVLRIALVNQYLIYKHVKKLSNLTLYEYLQEATLSDCESTNPYFKRTMHFPSSVKTRGLCEHCKNVHSLTPIKCPACSSYIHQKCFVDFHLKKHIYY
ncbi:predicted protein [Naegleria gruberi]|uniref:Predicted protein n=1 Tax=Naegleria gruberi TaxID=5762 RepID=D2W6R0_NAEGR|nr:uncharacterized protein NAEGRDRAFT_77104 [Naegleria gruberi]EFC35242.1 predicted protein [Naegleria gruberi]|eukprot:XP_002667986.1 predicted protein [Naegleria gruberi strain NEG-M]